MRAQELMTRDPACCSPDDTLADAARMMREHDCGAIPVCEHHSPEKVVGMITDRDMAGTRPSPRATARRRPSGSACPATSTRAARTAPRPRWRT